MLKIKAFTLIELMIVLLISVILLAGLLEIGANMEAKTMQALQTQQLDQSLQRSMALMIAEIRRAGYWSNATSMIDISNNTNPFMTGSGVLSVNGANNCILFTYDREDNGTLPTLGAGPNNDDERVGFRLQSNAIQARPQGASFSCTAAASAWNNITDPNVMTITQLQFTLTTTPMTVGNGPSKISINTVSITITGRLVANSSITRTLSDQVRIQNDVYAAS